MNRQSKQTRNAIKNISDREIYQLVMHEKNSCSKHVTKMGWGGGGGGGKYAVTPAAKKKVFNAIKKKIKMMYYKMSVLNLVGLVGFRGYLWVISVGIHGYPWVISVGIHGYPWVISVGHFRGSFPWVSVGHFCGYPEKIQFPIHIIALYVAVLSCDWLKM